MKEKHSVGWLSAASFGLAGTINFFNLGPVLLTVGNIGILLFIIGMVIALLSGFGWLKIVLHNTDKVGGGNGQLFRGF